MTGHNILIWSLLLLTLFVIADGIKSDRTSFSAILSKRAERLLGDDPLVSVDPVGLLGTKFGSCSCECCMPPSKLKEQKCVNDIVVAVDSSACFRDHQRRMKQFLRRLVTEIEIQKQYGVSKTRLALMQFSSTTKDAVRLDSYKIYQDPPKSKALKDLINEKIMTLGFLGQGAFLDRALNATYDHFVTSEPRLVPYENTQKTVIMLTNGKSHPNVTREDVEYSISQLRHNNISILPVSVTRQCYGNSAEWKEGMCPDVEILKALGKDSYPNEEFLAMRSSGTIKTVVKEATKCTNTPPGELNTCKTCNCSCELPIGPRGPPGPRGYNGTSITGSKGEVGPIGKNGTKGNVGPKGEQGVKGAKGGVGPKGEKGDIGGNGTKGSDGEKGEKGEKGDIGIIGPKGIKGEVGFKGRIGKKGDIGPKGDTGERGPKGAKGEIGLKGSRGPKGEKGEPGIGIKGIKGGPGQKGDKGDDGNDGFNGTKGTKGDRGLCGKPGPAGHEGRQGIPGTDGEDGEQGVEGPQGPRGEQGIPGLKGDRGEEGIIGEPGRRGPRGPRGQDGREGPRGQPGSNGLDSNVAGLPGLEGPQGPRGERGYKGADGMDGIQGPPGVQGPRGEPGPKGNAGIFDLEALKPMLFEIIRDLMPGECIEPPDCSEYPIDLVFLVDGSDSIDRDDFNEVKNWILKTTERFNPAVRDKKLQLDVVQFSDSVRTEVHQIILKSADEISDTVRNMEQMRSSTNTYSALKYINNNATLSARQGSFKILITMTDGDASDDRDQDAINKARETYNIMLSVGIGDKIRQEHLEDFAYRSQPISVDEFASLGGIIDKIVETSCTGIEEETKPMRRQETPPLIENEVYSRCVDGRADIAFLIDGSPSVDDEDYDMLRGFLQDIVGSFKHTSSSAFRISLIQYTEEPKTELHFNESVNRETVMKAIGELKFTQGNKKTGYALDTVGRIFEEVRLSGTRPGVPQVAIVITNGRSEDDVREPVYSLRDAGVALFAIGVTDNWLEEELRDIAFERNVHNVNSFEMIKSIEEDLVKGVCQTVRGSFIVYDEDGKMIESIIFGDDGEDSQGDDGWTLGSGWTESPFFAHEIIELDEELH